MKFKTLFISLVILWILGTSNNKVFAQVVNTDKLKADLKARICDFLTEAEVKQIIGQTVEGHVSGFDGTTTQYCSYNLNGFKQEIRFAYIFSTLGNTERVQESIKMFNESSLERITVRIPNQGAFWNKNTNRLVVFFKDAQVLVDLRKFSSEQPKEKAIAIFEKAMEGY